MSTRSYLSIGDVLSLLREEFPDVTISKIRFLESQGLVDPERSPSGYRKFYDHDVERLRWVLRQQRDQFLPLKVIRDRLAAAGNGVPPDEPDETAGPGRGAGAPAGEQKHDVWANGATASPSSGASRGGAGAGPAAEEHGRGGSVEERYDAQRGNVVRFDAERRQPASAHPASGPQWPVKPGASPGPTSTVGDAAEPPRSTGAPAGAQVGASAPGAVAGPTAPAAADTGGAPGGGDRVDADVRTRTPGLFADVAARGGGTGSATGRRAADVSSAEAIHGGAPGVGASAAASAPPAGGAAAGGASAPGSGGPVASGAGRASAAAGVTPATGAAAMGDRVRDGERAIRPSAGSPGTDADSAANMLTGSVSGVSLTLTELSAATGLSPQMLASLESFGLIAPMAIAGDTFYDEEALTAAKLVAEFAKFGIEPRHLRLYRNAVDREAGLVEQVITPLLRQRNPESRQRAMDAAAELTRLGQGLRAALVRAELRRQFGG